MNVVVSSGDVTGASTKTLLGLLAASAKTLKLRQLIVGCSGAPADATAVIAVRGMTADGTGTSVTPHATGRQNGTPSSTCKANYTVEPTYETGNMFRVPLNQRVTMIDNLPFGAELETNLSGGTVVGWGIQMVSGPALAYETSAFFEE